MIIELLLAEFPLSGHIHQEGSYIKCVEVRLLEEDGAVTELLAGVDLIVAERPVGVAVTANNQGHLPI